MHVLRLYFASDEDPLDVAPSDVVEIRPDENRPERSFVAIELSRRRQKNPTYLPERIETAEREDDSDIDLHNAYLHE